MICWRQLVEEYHPRFLHVAGKDNCAADALSRLEMNPNDADVIDWEPKHDKMVYEKLQQMCTKMVRQDMEESDDEYDDLLHDMEISESQARHFIQDEYYDCEFALDVRMFKEHQERDIKLQDKVKKSLKQEVSAYSVKEVEGVELIHCRNKIVVPSTLIQRVMSWYHEMLCHPGTVKMEKTINRVYTWPKMRKDIEQKIKTCPTCQKCKRSMKNKNGLLPEKEAEVTKWNRVNLDCWGPKTIKQKNGFDYEIYVLTMVDPVTGWFEYAQLYEAPTAMRCQELFRTTWLSRYPRPREIGFDNGSEFKAELTRNMGLKECKSLPWNPQSKTILERIHQVLQDCLVTLDLDNVDIDEDDHDPFEKYLALAAHAIRAGYHSTHGKSPCEMVFERDMYMPVKSTIDWDAIKARKQEKIAKSNERENKKRYNHHFSPGDWITITKPGILRKLCVPREGPYQVIKHHDNGMITYEKAPFTNAKVNIRRVSPFHWQHANPQGGDD